MQITILGASGQLGRVVINEALRKGYTIKVLVRNPEKLGELKEKVEVVTGNLLDELCVDKALEGSEAVINVSGAVKEPDQVKKFDEVGKILVNKMKKQGVTRLINISLAVISLPNEKLDFQRKILKILVNLFFKDKKEVQETVMNRIIPEKNISWTFVRPAFFSTKAGTRKVLADENKMPGTTIRLEDLAMFMIDQVISTEWIGKAPFVSSKTN
jgi:putative NADH-flavin reductase